MDKGCRALQGEKKKRKKAQAPKKLTGFARQSASAGGSTASFAQRPCLIRCAGERKALPLT
jgi:hypothetical protein